MTMTIADRVRLRIIRTAYALANAMFHLLRRLLWPLRPRKAPQNICLYRIGNVGDIVCALPAMRAVRRTWCQARLVLLTSPGSPHLPGAREILRGARWLDDLIVYDKTMIADSSGKLALIRRLRGKRFDMWIELPNNRATFWILLRNILFARLTGARWAGGWRLSTLRIWGQLQSEYLHFPNEVERLLTIMREEGIEPEPVEFGWPDAVASVDEADALLARMGLPPADFLIALAPGSKRTTNRWLPERWVQVGRALAARGYRLLVLGAAAEQALCDLICQSVGPVAVSLAGRTDLPTLAEVLRRCRLAVCLDSGVQHVAAAVGTRCVSLFSARDHHGKWHPYGEHAVIEKRVPCHTCLLEVCPHDNYCMGEITADEVIAAVFRQLSRAPAAWSGAQAGSRPIPLKVSAP